MKIDELRLTIKLVSKLRMFNRTNEFNKGRTFDKTIESIKRIISRNNYERTIDEDVVSFLKGEHLMRALSS